MVQRCDCTKTVHNIYQKKNEGRVVSLCEASVSCPKGEIQGRHTTLHARSFLEERKMERENHPFPE